MTTQDNALRKTIRLARAAMSKCWLYGKGDDKWWDDLDDRRSRYDPVDAAVGRYFKLPVLQYVHYAGYIAIGD